MIVVQSATDSEMTDSETSTETSRRRAPLREELSSQFQQCVSSVKHYTRRFEDEAVRPAMTYYGGLYERRPLVAIFFAILFGLSFLPILAFTVTSYLTLISFVSFALIFSLTAATGIILCFSSVLILTLIVCFFIAAITTDIAFSAYLVFRLLISIREKGVTEGFVSWIGEVGNHVVILASGARQVIPERIVHYVTAKQSESKGGEPTPEHSDYDVKLEGLSNMR